MINNKKNYRRIKEIQVTFPKVDINICTCVVELFFIPFFHINLVYGGLRQLCD